MLCSFFHANAYLYSKEPILVATVTQAHPLSLTTRHGTEVNIYLAQTWHVMKKWVNCCHSCMSMT